MRPKQIFILFIALLLTAHSVAQTDSSFVNSYKVFRTVVDTLDSYCLYYIPYQSNAKQGMPEAKPYFRDAFHFLRSKEIDFRFPDFIVGVQVDSLETEAPVTELKEFNKNWETYNVRTTYSVSFGLLLYVKGRGAIKLPLFIGEKFTKERIAAIRNQVDPRSLRSDVNLEQYIQIHRSELSPTDRELRQNFLTLLGYVKNRYIDRVDN